MKEFSVENLLFVTEIDFWKTKFYDRCHQSDLVKVDIAANAVSKQDVKIQLDERKLMLSGTTRSISRQNSTFSTQYDTCCLTSGLEYLNMSPIMNEKSYAKSLILIIEIFIKENAVDQINIAYRQKKRLLKNKMVLNILELCDNDNLENFDDSKLTPKDLQIFDEIYLETIKNLKDSYQRFVQTIEFTTFLRASGKSINTEDDSMLIN